MKTAFSVKKLKYLIQKELPGAWTEKDYRALLELMDYDDADQVAVAELREMCLLSLTDFEAPEAAEILLGYRIGDTLSKGQITNLAHEMQDQEMWEEYSDMTLHQDIYHVNQLLQAAGMRFPQPNAVKLDLAVKGLNPHSLELLRAPTTSLIIKLLAEGMDSHSTLIRLFEDQLREKDFPEADAIIWEWEHRILAENLIEVTLFSSNYWLEDFKEVTEYETEIINAA